MRKNIKISTSKFGAEDINILNIIFENRDVWNIVDVEIPEYLYLDRKSLLLEQVKKSDFTMKEARTIITHILRVSRNETVTIGTDESKTDSFVNYLFGKIGFNEDPYIIALHNRCEFRFGNRYIKSIPDVVTIKDDILVLVAEDKHIRNVSSASQFGEYQIAGELIASAYINYRNYLGIHNTIYRSTVYAVRVIGTRFTFYSCTVPIKYIMELEEAEITSQITVFRHPSLNNVGEYSFYDYKDPNDRDKILDILFSIKEEIYDS
jgi:hypothetical protein